MSAIHQIQIDRFGTAETLGLSQTAAPAGIEHDEVQIAVNFSGINFADIQMRLGFYPDAPKKPFVPGYEVSGIVKKIGPNVTHVNVGDPVVAGTYFGGYASQVTVPAHQVFPLPQSMSLAEGAALPVNFFTAHLALFEMARIRPGDRVLIEGATGGVGTMAVQMAKAVGAEITGLTSSRDKLAYIEALGATAFMREEFEGNPKLTGYDFILNSTGGPSIKAQRQRLAITGRMVCMGLSSGVKDGRRNFFRLGLAAMRTARIGVFGLMDSNSGIFGLNALHVLEDEEWVTRLTQSLDRVEELNLRPHVDTVFPADKVSDAHRHLETKAARGKVLLAWQ